MSEPMSAEERIEKIKDSWINKTVLYGELYDTHKKELKEVTSILFDEMKDEIKDAYESELAALRADCQHQLSAMREKLSETRDTIQSIMYETLENNTHENLYQLITKIDPFLDSESRPKEYVAIDCGGEAPPVYVPKE